MAITELGKASQEDPFILMLLAQSYEKAGDPAHAKEYYGKAMVNNGHGPRKKLAGGCVVAAVCESLSLASAPARVPSARWPRS